MHLKLSYHMNSPVPTAMITRVHLKTANTPKQRVFSRCAAPFFLEIHKVFLRQNGLPNGKIPRRWSYFPFSDRPYLKLENFHTGPSPDHKVLQRIANSNKLNMKNDLARIQHLSSEENIGSVIKLIGDIQQEIARQMSKHHQVVNHYMSEYGYIPLWVLVNVLTFGKITTFYKLMKPADKMTVAKKFGIASDELHKYMDMCSLARNKCAHDERFFDIKFRRSLHTRSIAKLRVLHLPRDASGSYLSGTNDAYAIAIIFAMLLSKTDTKEFVSAMKSAFGKLAKALHTISVNDVMNIMGYSCSWTNLPKLKE